LSYVIAESGRLVGMAFPLVSARADHSFTGVFSGRRFVQHWPLRL